MSSTLPRSAAACLAPVLLLLSLAPAHPSQLGQASGQVPGQLPARATGVPTARPPLLFASGYTSATVHVFDPVTGEPLGNFGSVPGAQSIRRGPDGLLYVCAEETDEVLRFDTEGRFIDAFVTDDPGTPTNETGGLNGPTAAVFGPDGNLYVASFNNDRVLQYDGVTGAFIKRFEDTTAGNLNGPDAGMSFGPGGDLYVPSFNNNRILRYDGVTGAYAGVFADTSSGLSRPRDIIFRQGFAYVTSWGSNEILRYDYAGNFVDVFATTVAPTGIAFGPHDGDLYVTSDANSYIKRLDGETGALLAKPVPNNGGVLQAGVFLRFEH